MKLIFKGREDKIKILERLNKNYASKNGVQVTIDPDNVEQPEVILPAKEVAVLISKVNSLDELEKYSTDKRQIAFNAYKKRFNELNNE